jgi:glycosyltransferase involved in cell wall biosynthesis
MRNISNDSSTKKQSLPEVEVLLATFNGEAFLGEFLESLSQQTGVKIHLRVSDDGSTDQTLALVRSYKTRFESCTISNGPSEGPSANFFSLIDKATYDYVALADQDDIWEKDKLSTQLSFLRSNAPHLVCHDRAVLNSSGIMLKDSQVNFRFLELKNALVENVVFGSTILLNKQGIDLVRNYLTPNVLMHDSYIYLAFSCFGQMTFIQKPLTKYRIHDGNFVGIPNVKTRIRKFRLNIDAFYRQNRAFFNIHKNEILESDTELFTRYFEIFELRSRFQRILHTISAPIARQVKIQTLIWKILVVIYLPKRLDLANSRRNSSM